MISENSKLNSNQYSSSTVSSNTSANVPNSISNNVVVENETPARRQRELADSGHKKHMDSFDQPEEFRAKIPPRAPRLESTKYTCSGKAIAENIPTFELLPAAKVDSTHTNRLQFSDSDDELPDETKSTSNTSEPKATVGTIGSGLNLLGLYASAATRPREAARFVDPTLQTVSDFITTKN